MKVFTEENGRFVSYDEARWNGKTYELTNRKEIRVGCVILVSSNKQAIVLDKRTGKWGVFKTSMVTCSLPFLAVSKSKKSSLEAFIYADENYIEAFYQRYLIFCNGSYYEVSEEMMSKFQYLFRNKIIHDLDEMNEDVHLEFLLCLPPERRNEYMKK